MTPTLKDSMMSRGNDVSLLYIYYNSISRITHQLSKEEDWAVLLRGGDGMEALKSAYFEERISLMGKIRLKVLIGILLKTKSDPPCLDIRPEIQCYKSTINHKKSIKRSSLPDLI